VVLTGRQDFVSAQARHAMLFAEAPSLGLTANTPGRGQGAGGVRGRRLPPRQGLPSLQATSARVTPWRGSASSELDNHITAHVCQAGSR
jgi:hypothetical protein